MLSGGHHIFPLRGQQTAKDHQAVHVLEAMSCFSLMGPEVGVRERRRYGGRL